MKKKNRNKDDLVTVVTVCYNAEDLIEETILSVIGQTYENIEYIIIDGASNDQTVDIIKKYKDNISHWISEPDEGIYYAMNKGIAHSTGQWINFMNAGDTFLDKDTVQYVMEHKDISADLIYGHYRKKQTGITIKAKDKRRWFKQMPFGHQTLFTKTEIMKQTMFDVQYRLAGDHDFILKMYQEGKEFNSIDKIIAEFDESGFSQTNHLLMSVESLKILFQYQVPLEEIEKSYWYKLLKKEICYDDREFRKGQQAVRQLQQLKNSKSWQVTAPLRKIYFLIRAFRTR